MTCRFIQMRMRVSLNFLIQVLSPQDRITTWNHFTACEHLTDVIHGFSESKHGKKVVMFAKDLNMISKLLRKTKTST